MLRNHERAVAHAGPDFYKQSNVLKSIAAPKDKKWKKKALDDLQTKISVIIAFYSFAAEGSMRSHRSSTTCISRVSASATIKFDNISKIT